VKSLTLLLLGLGMFSTTYAADIDIFTSSELQAQGQVRLAKGAQYSDKTLARYGNHYFLVVKREETGASELHEHEADVFVIEAGQGSILTGGKIVNPHATKPGEIRGSSITGGKSHPLSAGDVIHIPAGVPHQLILEKGKPFVYFVVKVTDQ
jgi:mannose-6-phosphate isomerase-like protein (cupin superfamily)